MKKIDILWGISIVLTALLTLIICISSMRGGVSVTGMRILGIALVICIPFVIYTTVRFVMSNRNRNDADNKEKDE